MNQFGLRCTKSQLATSNSGETVYYGMRCHGSINTLALDENVEVADVQDFKELKSYLTRHLEDHWLQEVFVFASKHIMFGKISPTGLAFLRCKLKQAPRE
jgi:hypothetical protein